MKRLIVILGLLLMVGVACSFNLGEVNEVRPSPQNTGNQPIPPTPPKDLYQTGTVNGKICYPGENVPDVILYLENKEKQEITSIPIPGEQIVFTGGLPPGKYVAYAWLRDYSAVGVYSEAVPCGLSEDCTDHSLIEFEVFTGEEVNDIQICDWNLSPSEIPYPPGIKYEQIHGSIAGNLGYPSEFIPAMTVVATNLDTNRYYYSNTNLNDPVYQIEHLPPGSYHVIAYVQGDDYGGGYTQSVLCGLSVECSDHSLIEVQVTAGQVTDGIHPVDFYAPEGTFPPNPVK
ncbi:MAG: carboxypeptidase-like regulatory domain-containing protein [Anaerolineales bacterium]